MKISEFFNGRFGSFYLIKIWAFTVLIGPILAGFLGLILIPDSLNQLSFETISSIILEIVYGFVLSLPSLIISEISYMSLSKTKLQNSGILIVLILISLLTTNLTYCWLLNNANEKGYLYIFSISYSLVMISSFLYFYRKVKPSLKK